MAVPVKQIGLQREAWGPRFWTILHTLAECSGKQNTLIQSNDEADAWIGLIRALPGALPCALCRQHFREWLVQRRMDHLRTISKDGYVDSVSNILIKALNNMAITERPLHCTDLKRETVYIKNNETWNKSTADEPLMNGLINTIENKHYAVVKHYVQTTPAARELDTPEYNFYAKACVHALGNYEDHDKLNKKIYKKVLPEIKLDKSVI